MVLKLVTLLVAAVQNVGRGLTIPRVLAEDTSRPVEIGIRGRGIDPLLIAVDGGG